jgi:putative ABC transport system permease protein
MPPWVHDFVHDLRFAFRASAKRPGFTAVAVITLALGIGAAAAVFSILDAVLLRPLPYKDPGRLVAIWITGTREKGLAKLFGDYTDYEEFHRHSRTLESVGAATWAKVNGLVLTGRGPAREVLAIPATASFFDTLGVPAALGRTFRSEDEGRACSLLLAHSLWTTSLGSDPAIVGRTLTLDERPCTVVGVMPASFGFYPRETKAWVLIGPNFDARAGVGIFGRLKPGVTIAQAEAELRSLHRAVHTGREAVDFQPVVYDLHGEFTFLASRTLRATIVLVFCAVLLLLLIACLNVGNLLLARLSERRRELAVRAALGSGQSRLVRQVLAEGLLLASGGVALGIALASAALDWFRLANPIELSVGADIRLNLPVLAFSAGLALTSTLIFALLPAFRASCVDLTLDLKSGGRGNIPGQQRLARFVVAVEMALSFTMLTGAGLLMASALHMGSENLGFNPDGVLAERVSLPRSHYTTDAQRLRAYDQLLAGLERLPGIAGAALASKVPPEAGGNQTLAIQGRENNEASAIHEVGADAVTPAFFDVLGIPVLSGRAFNAQDRENSTPVAIVNQALAEKYFPNANPIGQQIRIPGGTMPWLTVVGVVGNLKHTQLMNEMSWVVSPIFYRPLAQEPRGSLQIAVRVAGETGSLVSAIRTQIAAVDPLIPAVDAESLHTRLARLLAYPRFRAVLFSFFAAAALLLSAVGLHGVLSQLVSRRIPEFGVRRAVGAQTGDLLLLIARQGGAPVVAGMIAGIGLTVASARILASLLYGIQPADPKAFAAVSVVLLGAAALAIALPAARAARVDPTAALREE